MAREYNSIGTKPKYNSEETARRKAAGYTRTAGSYERPEAPKPLPILNVGAKKILDKDGKEVEVIGYSSSDAKRKK